MQKQEEKKIERSNAVLPFDEELSQWDVLADRLDDVELRPEAPVEKIFERIFNILSVSGDTSLNYMVCLSEVRKTLQLAEAKAKATLNVASLTREDFIVSLLGHCSSYLSKSDPKSPIANLVSLKRNEILKKAVEIQYACDEQGHTALTRTAVRGDIRLFLELHGHSEAHIEQIGKQKLLVTIISDVLVLLEENQRLALKDYNSIVASARNLSDKPRDMSNYQSHLGEFQEYFTSLTGMQKKLEAFREEKELIKIMSKFGHALAKLNIRYKKMRDLSHSSGVLPRVSNQSSAKGDEKSIGAGGSLKNQFNGASVTSSSSSSFVSGSSVLNKRPQLPEKKEDDFSWGRDDDFSELADGVCMVDNEVMVVGKEDGMLLTEIVDSLSGKIPKPDYVDYLNRLKRLLPLEMGSAKGAKMLKRENFIVEILYYFSQCLLLYPSDPLVAKAYKDIIVNSPGIQHTRNKDGYTVLRMAANAGNVKLFLKLWEQWYQEPSTGKKESLTAGNALDSQASKINDLIFIIDQTVVLIKQACNQAHQIADEVNEKEPMRPRMPYGGMYPVLSEGVRKSKKVAIKITLSRDFEALNKMKTDLEKTGKKRDLIKLMVTLTEIIERTKETVGVSVNSLTKAHQEQENSKARSSHHSGQTHGSFLRRQPPDSKEQGIYEEFMKDIAKLEKKFDEIAGGGVEDLEALEACSESIDSLIRELCQLQQQAETSLSTERLRIFRLAVDPLTKNIFDWKKNPQKISGLETVLF